MAVSGSWLAQAVHAWTPRLASYVQLSHLQPDPPGQSAQLIFLASRPLPVTQAAHLVLSVALQVRQGPRADA